MVDSLKQRCEIFVKNRDIFKDHFKWDNSALHLVCASIYTQRQLKVNENEIKTCKEIIKQSTGIMSTFRSTTNLVLATMLSLEKNPQDKFREVLQVYSLLKEEFFSSTYLPLSAMVIANIAKAEDYKRVIQKAKGIYKSMKKEHPFLTSGEDSGFAVMFALSDLSIEESITEMEKCYRFLQGKFFSANAIQSLSHTLGLAEEECITKCNKVMDIVEGLKSKNCKFGTGIELSILGVLAMTTDNTEQIIKDIVEVNEYLLTCKGFGPLGTGKTQRIMYSAILVEQEYSNKCSDHLMDMATINSITSIIIAEQVAVTTAITASMAATTASN